MFEGPCNCVVAVAFSKIYDMQQWESNFLDKILELGDGLYLKSLQKLEDKAKTTLSVSEVYSTFYLKETKIQMAIDPKITGDLFKKAGRSFKPSLADFLKTFFEKYKSGVVVAQKKHFAIWTAGNYKTLLLRCKLIN